MTDWLSPSPFAGLSNYKPYDLHKAIYSHMHERREDWCNDARRARDYQARIAELEAALDIFVSYGCPACGGDCSSANPPVYGCPMQAARAALRNR